MSNEIPLITTEVQIESVTSNPLLENETSVSGDDIGFDTESLLLQNVPEIFRVMPKFMQYCENPVYLSENSRIILAAVGDLNGDGNSDLAVIVEFSETDENSLGYAEGEFGFGPRYIYVLFGNSDGSYTIVNKNESLILDHNSGGVFGDPLEDLLIENDVLIIKHYGGSSDRWGYDMYFIYKDRQLILSKMVAIYHSTLTANGETTICDFINQKIEKYSSSVEDKFNNYFLYGGELPAKTYLFNSVTFGEIVALSDIPFLPYLGSDYYQFGRFDKPLDLKISASQALDMIMTEHYPDFEKVYIPLTQENKDNYSKLLSYEIPDYYYQGSSGTLEYFYLDIVEDEEGAVSRATHNIIFNSSGNENTEFYEIEDK